MHLRQASLLLVAYASFIYPVTARPWGFGWGGGWGGVGMSPWNIASGFSNIIHEIESWMPCPVEKASMPQAPVPLPPPSPGLQLSHVAIGRGTQNYTCPTGCDPSSAPIAAGAVASLFNVSCMAGSSPRFANRMASIALRFPVPAPNTPLAPADLFLSGHHYFVDATTPFFNLDTSATSYGQVAAAKLNATSAPCAAEDVPWLKLAAKPGDWQYKEIYRVNTAGGVAPATCQGQPVNIQVQYAAEYWFWA